MDNVINIAGGTLIGLVVIIVIVLHKRSIGNFNLDKRYFKRRWNKIQKKCSDKKMWCQAIIDADELLDEALRLKHFKGKSTGERLVSAQHHFSANDNIWYSHKLKNRIQEENLKKLSKTQTIEALSSFKRALIDIGALTASRKSKANAK